MNPLRTRRGAASLVVVMVLFFIITLVAAYTSRNLLFEQRTSANQYRSTLALEAAEAGVEWAIARLNEGRMDNNCTELPNAAAVNVATPQPSFRQRYLSIDGTTGFVTPVGHVSASTPTTWVSGCVFNGSAWVCQCPSAAGTEPDPSAVALGTTGPFPAFWVRFEDVNTAAIGGKRPGIVRIRVNACTRPDASCLRFNREAQAGDGLATVWATVVLRSGLTSAPAAALTVRGTFNVGAADETTVIRNTSPEAGGITIHASGNVNAGSISLFTQAGSLPSRSIVRDDASLAFGPLSLGAGNPANSGDSRMFASVFGMWPQTYFDQPGVAVVNCPSNCNAAAVNDAALLWPGKPILVQGGGELRINADIGSAAQPVLIIAAGNVEFESTPRTVHGLIYSRATTWELDGNGTIRGAAIAEQNFEFDDDDLTIEYDRAILQLLRYRTGSFTRLHGGWRDYQP